MREIRAGCENGHCTVEFRRPEGKRAEVRWTTPMRSEHRGFVYMTQPVRMLSQ